MVGSCRCLKENVDELRIETVCYERVTGYPEVIGQPPVCPLSSRSVPAASTRVELYEAGQLAERINHVTPS
jgi:hypothetical protein